MKELISIITAADEHYTLRERIIFGFAYPLGLLALMFVASALFA